MSGARLSPRRSPIVSEPVATEVSGNLALLGLRFALMGCVVALVGVLGHVAWKIMMA